jgi:hypothetical protein
MSGWIVLASIALVAAAGLFMTLVATVDPELFKQGGFVSYGVAGVGDSLVLFSIVPIARIFGH